MCFNFKLSIFGDDSTIFKSTSNSNKNEKFEKFEYMKEYFWSFVDFLLESSNFEDKGCEFKEISIENKVGIEKEYTIKWYDNKIKHYFFKKSPIVFVLLFEKSGVYIRDVYCKNNIINNLLQLPLCYMYETFSKYQDITSFDGYNMVRIVDILKRKIYTSSDTYGDFEQPDFALFCNSFGRFLHKKTFEYQENEKLLKNKLPIILKNRFKGKYKKDKDLIKICKINVL